MKSDFMNFFYTFFRLLPLMIPANVLFPEQTLEPLNYCLQRPNIFKNLVKSRIKFSPLSFEKF